MRMLLYGSLLVLATSLYCTSDNDVIVTKAPGQFLCELFAISTETQLFKPFEFSECPPLVWKMGTVFARTAIAPLADDFGSSKL